MPAEEQAATKPWTGVVSALVKPRPGAVPPLEPRLRWTAARGECEGAQVWVAPGAQGVALTATGLSSSTEPKASLPVSLFRVHYVPVVTPSKVVRMASST